MSIAVLISICPEWCEKIASGQKTIEVRKTRPKIETPFKCYIYESHGDKEYYETFHEKTIGKVIGEFVCDEDVYGWHISDLVIYDKPKELSEFAKPCYFKSDCGLCKAWDPWAQDCMKKHIKAPKSWCYVEELK